MELEAIDGRELSDTTDGEVAMKIDMAKPKQVKRWKIQRLARPCRVVNQSVLYIFRNFFKKNYLYLIRFCPID